MGLAGTVERDEALGLSRGGLTTKPHLAADGRARPPSLVATAGQAGDAPQFEQVVRGIRVPRPGPPRTRPDTVTTDAAYSSRAGHLRRRAIRHSILDTATAPRPPARGTPECCAFWTHRAPWALRGPACRLGHRDPAGARRRGRRTARAIRPADRLRCGRVDAHHPRTTGAIDAPSVRGVYVLCGWPPRCRRAGRPRGPCRRGSRRRGSEVVVAGVVEARLPVDAQGAHPADRCMGFERVNEMPHARVGEAPSHPSQGGRARSSASRCRYAAKDAARAAPPSRSGARVCSVGWGLPGSRPGRWARIACGLHVGRRAHAFDGIRDGPTGASAVARRLHGGVGVCRASAASPRTPTPNIGSRERRVPQRTPASGPPPLANTAREGLVSMY